MRTHNISVMPFDERHLEPAARLFTQSYAALRAETDLLPPQFVDPAAVAPRLENLLQDNDGAVAFRDGQFAGYLAAYSSIPGFFGRGPGVYVPVWGHGVTSPQMAADVFLALYTEMSALWVERGCYSQAISYFVDSGTHELEQMLLDTGFALQVIDGIRPMNPIAAVSAQAIDIRRSTESDLTAAQELDIKLRRHLRSAPIFLNTQPASAEDLPEAYLGDGVCTLLAWQNGVPVGGIRGVLNGGDGCDLFNVEGTLAVNFGFTEPAARRGGIATALLDAMLQWGRENGMVRCAVDFESANVTARRFWLTHFQPACHSAVRKVDDRL